MSVLSKNENSNVEPKTISFVNFEQSAKDNASGVFEKRHDSIVSFNQNFGFKYQSIIQPETQTNQESESQTQFSFVKESKSRRARKDRKNKESV